MIFDTLTLLFCCLQLFRFLSRRTDSAFTATVLRRLISSRINRPPISVSKCTQLLKGQDKIVVAVCTVTDDARFIEMPKMTIAALRFTEAARAKIVKAGGKCLTLDQLIMTAPTGKLSVPFLLNQPLVVKTFDKIFNYFIRVFSF